MSCKHLNENSEHNKLRRILYGTSTAARCSQSMYCLDSTSQAATDYQFPCLLVYPMLKSKYGYIGE